MIKECEKRLLSSIILIPIALFFIFKGSFLFNFFIILCLVISLYEWQMMSNKKSYNISGHLFLNLRLKDQFLFQNIEK